MVEGGMKCIKYLLFAFNLIFFLAGLGLIIAGALVQTKFNDYFDFFGGQFSAAAILLIVVGSVIFIIGFFGCCGAYKENYCMVMTFAVLLGLIFILEIAAGITAYVLRDKVRNFAEEKLSLAEANYGMIGHEGVTQSWMKAQKDVDSFVKESLDVAILKYDAEHSGVVEAWDRAQKEVADVVERSLLQTQTKYGELDSKSATSTWDRLQTEFECCGVNNFTDWGGKGTVSPGQVPASCCLPEKDCTTAPSKTNVYDSGCMEKFSAWIEENIFIIGGVGIGLAFVQVLGVIISCCLGKSIRKEYEVV